MADRGFSPAHYRRIDAGPDAAHFEPLPLPDFSESPPTAPVVTPLASAALQMPGEALAAAEAVAADVARFDAQVGPLPYASPALLAVEALCSARLAGFSTRARVAGHAMVAGHGYARGIDVARTTAMISTASSIGRALDGHSLVTLGAIVAGEPVPSPVEQWQLRAGEAGVRFTGLSAGDLAVLTSDLARFAQRTDIPLLARTAIAYAQVQRLAESTGDDGRVSRAVGHALMRGYGLTRDLVIPLSAGIRHDRPTWRRAAAAYEAGNIGPAITSWTTAVAWALGQARQLIVDLGRLRHSWSEQVDTRRGAKVWELIDIVLGAPVFDAPGVAAQLGIAQQNGQRAIAPLLAAGLIEETTGKRRGRLYWAPAVTRLFDKFVVDSDTDETMAT